MLIACTRISAIRQGALDKDAGTAAEAKGGKLVPARRDDGAAKLLGAERGERRRRRVKRASLLQSGISRHDDYKLWSDNSGGDAGNAGRPSLPFLHVSFDVLHACLPINRKDQRETSSEKQKVHTVLKTDCTVPGAGEITNLPCPFKSVKGSLMENLSKCFQRS